MGENMVQIPASVWQPDYQYFYMKDKNGNNRISDEHLELIKQNYKNILSEYSNFNNSTEYLAWIESKINARKMECLKEEGNFVKQLKYQHADFKAAYYDLIDRSGPEAIKLFTDYFSLGKIGNKMSTPDLSINRQMMDFKIAVSSQEFTQLMKSKGPEGGSHFFSREKFAKAMGISVSKKDKKLTKKSESEIRKALVEEVEKDKDSSKFWNGIYKAFDGVTIDGKQTELSNLLNQVQIDLKNRVKSFSEDEYREKVRDILDLALIDANQAGLIDLSKTGGGLNISFDDNSPIFLRMTIKATPGAMEKTYTEKAKLGNEVAYKEGAVIFVEAMGTVLNDMAGEKNLNLLWVNVDLDEKTFWTNVFSYYDTHKDEMISLTEGIMGRQDGTWKEKFFKELDEIISKGKKPYDFISGITGMVGEFAAATGYRSFSDLIVDANGAAHDKLRLENKDGTIVEKDFGQSFKDLVINDRYGVNIKYYLSATDAITLYEPKKDFKGYRIIGNDTLFKYIDIKTLMMMRFIEANYSYLTSVMGQSISTDKLDKTYLNVSIANLGNFLRQSTTIPDAGMNIFFQINNMIIPSSAIYEIILKSIQQEKGMFKYGQKAKENLWFKVVRNGTIPYDSYDNINQKIINEHYIQNLKNNGYKGASIYFKGLKIRKEDLSKMI